MRLLSRILGPRLEATAHCDLPCGVYDPAQARIEAESVKAIQEKYQDNEDPEFRTRAILIKEQRSELVKHHLWVLWTDYFKPPHFEKYPELHELFNKATKAAGATGTKGSMDPATGQELLDLIAEIDKIFWETKQGLSSAEGLDLRISGGVVSLSQRPRPGADVVFGARRGGVRRRFETYTTDLEMSCQSTTCSDQSLARFAGLLECRGSSASSITAGAGFRQGG